MTALLRPDPRRGLVRGVRAGLLTVPAVGGATLAHSLGDGCVSVVGVLAALGLCWPAAVALLGVRRRLPALGLWLVVAQAVTHLLLERTCDEVVAGQMGLLEHLRMGLHPAMLAAHVGAVLLTAVLLGRADAGLWAAQALVRSGARALGVVRALVLPVGPMTARPLLVVTQEVPALRDLWKAALPARRGPPVPRAL